MSQTKSQSAMLQTDVRVSVGVNQPPKKPVNTLLDCRTFTDVVRPEYSPEEHQKQGHGTQILTVCECRNLEGCDHTNSQGHGDQIHDLWKKMKAHHEVEKFGFTLIMNQCINKNVKIFRAIHRWISYELSLGIKRYKERAMFCIRCSKTDEWAEIQHTY